MRVRDTQEMAINEECQLPDRDRSQVGVRLARIVQLAFNDTHNVRGHLSEGVVRLPADVAPDPNLLPIRKPLSAVQGVESVARNYVMLRSHGIPHHCRLGCPSRRERLTPITLGPSFPLDERRQ